MLGWTPRDITNVSSGTIAANLSAVPLGKTFNINSAGATEALLVGIQVSGLAGTVSVQLQHAVTSSFENVSGKSVTLSNGWNYIRVHAGVAADAALMPLLGVGRLTITSNGSGAGTIDSLVVFQQL